MHVKRGNIFNDAGQDVMTDRQKLNQVQYPLFEKVYDQTEEILGWFSCRDETK